MRITLSIDKNLLQEIKKKALQSKLSLSTYIENLLRLALSKSKKVSKKTPFKLITVKVTPLTEITNLDCSSEFIIMGDKEAYHSK